MYYYSNERDDKLDNLADLSRVLSGEPLKDLSEYCSQERVKALGKIMDDYSPILSDD